MGKTRGREGLRGGGWDSEFHHILTRTISLDVRCQAYPDAGFRLARLRSPLERLTDVHTTNKKE